MQQEEADREWYQSGLRFQCTQCGNCCSGPGTGFVWVEADEIEQLAIAFGMGDDIEGFERKFVRRIGQRKSLVEYFDGDCIFLDPKSRGCLLYHARPTQCRSWPFWDKNLESPKAWAKAAAGCPGCNHGPLYEISTIRSLKTGP